MKYLIIGLLFLSSPSWGFNLITDIRDKTEIHAFDNIIPATFVGIREGRFYGGVLTEAVSYRCFSLLGGVRKNLDENLTTLTRYEPVVSTALKLDYFENSIIRRISDKAPLFQRMSVGPYVGYSFSSRAWMYGVVITAKFDISNLRGKK